MKKLAQFLPNFGSTSNVQLLIKNVVSNTRSRTNFDITNTSIEKMINYQQDCFSTKIFTWLSKKDENIAI